MKEKSFNYTGILVLIYAVMVLAAGVFMTLCYNKIRAIPNYTNNFDLNSAKNYALIGLIFSYLAGAGGLLLAFIYFTGLTKGFESGALHIVVFLGLIALLTVAGVFAFLTLYKLNSSKVSTNGSIGWIWAAQVVSLIAVIILIVAGAWKSPRASLRKLQSFDRNNVGDFDAPNYDAPGSHVLSTSYAPAAPQYFATVPQFDKAAFPQAEPYQVMQGADGRQYAVRTVADAEV